MGFTKKFDSLFYVYKVHELDRPRSAGFATLSAYTCTLNRSIKSACICTERSESRGAGAIKTVCYSNQYGNMVIEKFIDLLNSENKHSTQRFHNKNKTKRL